MKFHDFIILFKIQDKFLSYHPNLAVKGEILMNLNENIKSYLKKMPAATKNQKVLVKAAHVWNQNNVVPVIKQYSKLLPNVKLLMIVRDPIYRYVSDIVQFNYGKALKANIKPIRNINGVIQGTVKSGHPFVHSGRHNIFVKLILTTIFFRFFCS